MTGEEFRRIAVLKTMQQQLAILRPQLMKLGVKDYYHLTHAERLVMDMLAEPGAERIPDLSLSLNWHLGFMYAEYQQFVAANGLTDAELPDELFGDVA